MQKPVAIWLLICCAFVFAMVVVGGVTRLTDSGLSMVEWKPIVGTIPPITENDWDEVFKKYHETGEFDKNEIYNYITEGIGEDILPENVDL